MHERSHRTRSRVGRGPQHGQADYGYVVPPESTRSGPVLMTPCGVTLRTLTLAGLANTRNNSARPTSAVTTAARDPRFANLWRLLRDFIGSNREHRLYVGGHRVSKPFPVVLLVGLARRNLALRQGSSRQRSRRTPTPLANSGRLIAMERRQQTTKKKRRSPTSMRRVVPNKSQRPPSLTQTFRESPRASSRPPTGRARFRRLIRCGSRRLRAP